MSEMNRAVTVAEGAVKILDGWEGDLAAAAQAIDHIDATTSVLKASTAYLACQVATLRNQSTETRIMHDRIALQHIKKVIDEHYGAGHD